MNREIAQKLYRYFLNYFLLGMADINNVSTLENFQHLKRIILKALEICDSDITNIYVRKEQMPVSVLPTPVQQDVTFKFIDTLRFKTEHHNQPDILFD